MMLAEISALTVADWFNEMKNFPLMDIRRR